MLFQRRAMLSGRSDILVTQRCYSVGSGFWLEDPLISPESTFTPLPSDSYSRKEVRIADSLFSSLACFLIICLFPTQTESTGLRLNQLHVNLESESHYHIPPPTRSVDCPSSWLTDLRVTWGSGPTGTQPEVGSQISQT